MIFILKNALNSILKNIRINIVILFALVAAFLFLFLGISYIDDVLYNLNDHKMNPMDSSVCYQGSSNVPASKNGTQLEASFATLHDSLENFNGVESFSISEFCSYENPVTDEKYRIRLVDENFSDFFVPNMIEGRYFSKEEITNGSRVCIAETVYQNKHNTKIGDILRIDDLELTVVGIIKRNADLEGVLVPHKALNNREIRDQAVCWYEVYANLNDIEKRFEINWGKLNFEGRIITSNELYWEDVGLIVERSTIIFILCLVILAYALLNLINIMTSKLENQKKEIGIRFALGASYKQISLQFFFEILFLILSAEILIFIFDPIISLSVSTIFNHYMGKNTILVMLSFSVLSSFLISVILINKFKKINIVEIIRDL